MLQKISLWRKIHLMYSFFVVRRIISHIVTFTFYCVVIPTSVFVPEVKISSWGVVYIPTTITLLNSVGTPRFVTTSIPLIKFYQNGKNSGENLLLLNIYNFISLVVAHSIYYSSGSSLRMLCPCIEREQL